MAYTYSDWSTVTTSVAAKIARLDLHIAEVSLGMTASVGSNGANRDTGSLIEYLRLLTEQRKELAAMPGASGVGTSGPRVRRIKFA